MIPPKCRVCGNAHWARQPHVWRKDKQALAKKKLKERRVSD